MFVAKNTLGEVGDDTFAQPVYYDEFGNVIDAVPRWFDLGESGSILQWSDGVDRVILTPSGGGTGDSQSWSPTGDAYASIAQTPIWEQGRAFAVSPESLQPQTQPFEYAAPVASFAPAPEPAPVSPFSPAPAAPLPVTQTIIAPNPLTGETQAQTVIVAPPPPAAPPTPWQSSVPAPAPSNPFYWTNAPAPSPPLPAYVEWAGGDAPTIDISQSAGAAAKGLTLGRLALALGSLLLLAK